VNIANPSSDRIGDTWSRITRQLASSWAALPPQWRSDRALMAFAAVVALSLLAAFHQVVHAGVERAAARDAAAYRLQALKAICSTERSAEQRALCQLTTPSTPRAGVRVATATR
jgi:hypothetical protein